MKPPASAVGYGTVTSPNYPRLYSPGIGCVLYSISAGEDQIIELQFVNFSMAPPIRNRCALDVRGCEVQRTKFKAVQKFKKQQSLRKHLNSSELESLRILFGLEFLSEDDVVVTYGEILRLCP